MYYQFAMKPPRDLSADNAGSLLVFFNGKHDISCRRDARLRVGIEFVELHGKRSFHPPQKYRAAYLGQLRNRSHPVWGDSEFFGYLQEPLMDLIHRGLNFVVRQC